MLVASSSEEAKRLVDWVENGVYHALKKGYLKTVLFGVCNDEEGLDLVEVGGHSPTLLLLDALNKVSGLAATYCSKILLCITDCGMFYNRNIYFLLHMAKMVLWKWNSYLTPSMERDFQKLLQRYMLVLSFNEGPLQW